MKWYFSDVNEYDLIGKRMVTCSEDDIDFKGLDKGGENAQQ